MPENRRRTEDAVDLESVSADRWEARREPASGTVTVAHIVYALHTLSILTGLLTAGLAIVSAFVFSAPSILAVIISYIFRSDAAGTWAESHYRWQIRTFWLAFFWLIVLYVLSLPLTLFFGAGIFILMGGLFVLGIWVAWRVLLGWKRLAARQSAPV